MPKNLAGLTIAALDRLSELARLQLFLQLVLEQLDDSNDETADRVSLLVQAYLPKAELCLEELEITLQRIRLLVMPFQEDRRDD